MDAAPVRRSSLSAAQVQDDLSFLGYFVQKPLYYSFNGVHTKPIPSIDGRRASFGLVDEIAEQMRFGVVL